MARRRVDGPGAVVYGIAIGATLPKHQSLIDSTGTPMDSSLLSYSLTGIVAHLVHLGIATVAVIVFVAIYVMMTPHHEFRLIRQGNAAAAISLGGAILGYTLPLAKAVAQSESIMDMLLWSGVALVAQLVAYGTTRLLLPQLSAHVDEGKTASAIFLAAIAVAIGLLNSAAMTA
ncbi:MAG: DUF350 domain-containing protein [Gemmatimonadaceae bacterium]|nr:DUF350 domain-containing protein [Gemmatimonadaceae bacterium]